MDFGIYSLPTYFEGLDGGIGEFYDRMVQMLVESESRGFSSAWVNEHHFHPFGGMIPEPPILLAAVAAQTSTIRLGTSVSLLPLRHPLAVAEAYAMVDQLSGGRLDFGIGRGFVSHDYQAFGVPFDEAQARVEESLEIVLAAWSGRPVEHHGTHYDVSGVEVWPTPRQRPHPPIWVAATSNRSTYEMAGRGGHNLLTLLYKRPLAETAESIGYFRDAATEAGLDATSLRVGSHIMVYCAEEPDGARQAARDAMERYTAQHRGARSLGGRGTVPTIDGMSVDEMVDAGLLCVGTPAECVDILRRVDAEVGLDSVDCGFSWGGLEPDAVQRSYDLFCDEVIPAYRAVTATTAG